MLHLTDHIGFDTHLIISYNKSCGVIIHPKCQKHYILTISPARIKKGSKDKMNITDHVIEEIKIDYALEKISEPERILFIDIETRGLSPSNAEIYMIGTAVMSGNGLYIRQFFADDPSEERYIIEEFAAYAADYDTIITFNGNAFDIPFIEKRAGIYGIAPGTEGKKGVDIYKRIKPYRLLLALPDLKQKTLEDFLGISRVDTMSGKDLIKIYDRYTEDPYNETYLQLLLRHNYDDVANLPLLIPLLSYPDVINGKIRAERAIKNNYRDYEGELKTELIIEFVFDTPVPSPVSAGFADCYLMLGGKKGKIRVAIFEGTLKFFYPDHRDYYYLPLEDRAIHKSTGQYVDKEYRQQAKPENCYTKLNSQFLPEWDTVVTPVFKHEYKDRTMFFELTEGIKNDPELFSRYAGHLMSMILNVL